MQIDHLRWTPLPAGSLRALARCPGNLYNRYDEGGYLIWFAPEKPVFLDGRQDPYEPRLVLEQIRIETTGDYAGDVRAIQHRLRVPADELTGRRATYDRRAGDRSIAIQIGSCWPR